jgi:hypothetical protein
MLKGRLHISLLVLLLGVNLAAGQDDLDRGKKALQKGDLDLAITALKRFLIASPHSGQANYYL